MRCDMTIIEEQYKWARNNWTVQKPDTIVIHHAAARVCSAQDVHRWHLQKGWMGIAYHYFIRKDGRIYRGRREEHIGGGLLGAENTGCIQICLEGCYEHWVVNRVDQVEKTVPEAQMTALIDLCVDIQKRRPEVNHFNRHAFYPSAVKDKKTCPGQYFPFDKFLERTFDEYMRRVNMPDRTACDDLYGYGVAFSHVQWGEKEKKSLALANALRAIADNWAGLQKVPYIGDLLIKLGEKLNTK